MKKIKFKGLVIKENKEKASIFLNYNYSKPNKEYKTIEVLLKEYIGKENIKEKHFFYFKGYISNNKTYVISTKLKYILDDTYWSISAPTVAGGPSSSSDSRDLKLKDMFSYFKRWWDK